MLWLEFEKDKNDDLISNHKLFFFWFLRLFMFFGMQGYGNNSFVLIRKLYSVLVSAKNVNFSRYLYGYVQISHNSQFPVTTSLHSSYSL